MSNKVFAGIDIGGTSVKFGLVDQKGQILYREQRPTMAEKGPTPLMHLITNISERLLYYAADEDFVVSHLGVGSPGAVDFEKGMVVGPCPNIPGWTGTKIKDILKDHLNMPVFVDNDANAMALAEHRFGAAVGSKSVLCVTVGTGIGGGIIIDNKIWRGATGSAAEVGHLSIDAEGPECACGGKGCVEAFCSSKAIIGRVKKQLKKSMTPVFEKVLNGSLDNLNIKRLFIAARKKDEVAMTALRETAYYLGVGLAGMVNLLNPETVVIGGGIADGGAGFTELVAAEIKKRAWFSATEQLRIVKARLGNDAGFIGAGILGDL